MCAIRRARAGHSRCKARFDCRRWNKHSSGSSRRCEKCKRSRPRGARVPPIRRGCVLNPAAASRLCTCCPSRANRDERLQADISISRRACAGRSGGPTAPSALPHPRNTRASPSLHGSGTSDGSCRPAARSGSPRPCQAQTSSKARLPANPKPLLCCRTQHGWLVTSALSATSLTAPDRASHRSRRQPRARFRTSRVAGRAVGRRRPYVVPKAKGLLNA